MHTFNGKRGTTIFHNGDYSGPIKILPKGVNAQEIEVPLCDLLEFVAQMIRDDRENVIAKMDDVTILGISKDLWRKAREK